MAIPYRTIKPPALTGHITLAEARSAARELKEDVERPSRTSTIKRKRQPIPATVPVRVRSRKKK